MLYPNAKIAAGHNNAGSLGSIEAITPTNDIPFDAPKMIPYNPGLFRVMFNEKIKVVGFESGEWLFNIMTRVQLAYARTTWCSGGWSGFVTVATRTLYDSYANYNATLVIVPPTSQQNIGILLSEGRQVAGYRDIVFKLRRMVAL